MGQGRRKSQRDYSYRQRKRSITSEVENQESMELMHFLGPAAIVRNRLETKSNEKLRKREPTPFPKTKTEPYTIPVCNPLDLVSKTREATMDSPRNVFLDNQVLHSAVDYPSPEKRQTVDSISSYLVYTFFNNSWILQNECRRELTEEKMPNHSRGSRSTRSQATRVYPAPMRVLNRMPERTRSYRLAP